ncbi:MAG: hypothetical protein ACRDOY_03070 [Nocardioidaceae bacterium]
MSRPFLRHYLQMLAAMLAGMLVLEPMRMLAVSALGWSAVFDRTEPAALAMATEMSIGMAAWMRFRGHGWAPTLEMCLAMFVPFVVLFVPLWTGLIGDSMVMIAGHLLMLPAMLLVMLRRPEEYGAWRSSGSSPAQHPGADIVQ